MFVIVQMGEMAENIPSRVIGIFKTEQRAVDYIQHLEMYNPEAKFHVRSITQIE